MNVDLFKLLLWRYLPAYFYPGSLGAVPQSRTNNGLRYKPGVPQSYCGSQYESCHILDTTYPSSYVLCVSFVAVLPQLVRGNGVPTVATRSTLIIYVSLNVRILDHPRDSLVAIQVDIGHKASNRHAKTGFLFCALQIVFAIKPLDRIRPFFTILIDGRRLACISRTPRCYGKLQAPIPLTPLAITCVTRWTRQYRNNFSRLIVTSMYRSSELLQEPIDGIEPPTYRLQGDCTAFVLYRLSRGRAVSCVPSATVLYSPLQNCMARNSAAKTLQQVRNDSNAYLAVLETAVLPIKLLTHVRFI